MTTDRKAAPVTVGADELRRCVRDVFASKGMAAAHAAIVADVLVWANLRGVDSHGVSRVPRYLEMIEAGELNPRAEPRVVSDSGATVLIEADRAAGPVAMTAAMDAAIRKAREAGIGICLARATTHTAAIGYYALTAARQGVAAIATAASVPNMAYHGTRAAGVSTAPWCIAVPGGARGPVVLDMGSGMVSIGKLGQARRLGQAIPAGWALDAEGNPTTDPKRAEIPLPLAGPKGAGLALMVECLTSLIASNPILADSAGKPAKSRRHRQNGLAIAIDIARFVDPVEFGREIDRLEAALKSLPRDPDVPEVLMPGERGAREFDRRSREGVPLPRAIFEELAVLAARLDVAPCPPLPAAGRS